MSENRETQDEKVLKREAKGQDACLLGQISRKEKKKIKGKVERKDYTER